MARTLVLDLDGTLVDSVPDLASALNRLMAARGLAAFTRPETAAMVGDGVEKLLERAFAARGQELDGAALAAFSSDYAAHAAVETRPFPGVAAGLRALAGEGWRLAVCTNKPEGAARALLSALGLAELLAAVGAGDSFDAGFLSEFVGGADLQACLRKGNLAGALSTTRPGGTEAFRDSVYREEFLREQAKILEAR